MMTLYHGSNVDIEEINLNLGRAGKDFGKGFYLSLDKAQAEVMAGIALVREKKGKRTLNTYLFDDKALYDGSLKFLCFDSYSPEWAKFIVANRLNKKAQNVHDYDVVYGPIADDKVGLQIRLYNEDYISVDVLMKRLQYIRPTFQYFFATERAVKLLQKI